MTVARVCPYKTFVNGHCYYAVDRDSNILNRKKRSWPVDGVKTPENVEWASSSGHLPNSGMELAFPALQADSSPLSHQGRPLTQ